MTRFSSSDGNIQRTPDGGGSNRTGAIADGQGIMTPASSDNDAAPVSFTEFIKRFTPDLELQKQYREFIQKEGPQAFLERKINKTMTRRDICILILNLGYPKKVVEDYAIFSLRELATILLRLMLNDSSFKPPREEESSEDDEDSFDSDSDSTTTTTTTTTTTRNSTPIYKRPKETPFKYTLPDFISGLSLANRIMVVTGAGISTSLGIPDFRSFKGLYNQLSKLNLSDPQKVFDLATFMEEPGLFYSIAHMVLPPEGKFALLHAFLKIIQDKGKLLRNYTQNIDNLEERAGIYPDKLIQCHGSFSHARCITCNSLFAGTKIYDHIRKQQIPRCSQCWKDLQEAPLIHGVIKPTITFFGEDLPERYHNNIKSDIRNCDMCIVIGTSLNVNPVAGIIKDIPFDVPKILINKDPIEGMGAFFNLKLYGLCDEVVSYVSKCLGDDWFIPHADHNPNSHFSAVMDNNGTYRIKKLR